MAEEGGGLGPLAGIDRRILLLASVGLILVVILVFFLFRGCAGRVRGSAFTTIYSNLDLKDASAIVVRLKDLGITYQIQQEGAAIAVPKEKADQARLGLAEKGLPHGGSVGWEIFDESKLGATDFDRRIQLIRAISGELARTIRSLTAIEDARVQIVIPEQRLFETAKAPVTASVLLKLIPARMLTISQINGIVHLVSSSVEGLQPENVTVVSSDGHILAPRSAATRPLPSFAVEVESTTLPATSEAIATPSATSPEASVIPIAVTATMTPVPTKISETPSPEEVQFKARKELGQKLTEKAKMALTGIFPPNVSSAQVSVDMGSRIRGTILVDQSFNLSPALKKIAFQGVASAIDFQNERGDRLELWRVPNLASTLGRPVAPQKPIRGGFRNVWFLFIVLALGVGFMVIRSQRSQPPADALPRVTTLPGDQRTTLHIRQIAEQNPQRVAGMIERWLAE